MALATDWNSMNPNGTQAKPIEVIAEAFGQPSTDRKIDLQNRVRKFYRACLDHGLESSWQEVTKPLNKNGVSVKDSIPKVVRR